MIAKISLRAAHRARHVLVAAALSLAAQTAPAQTITARELGAPGSITYDGERVPVVQAATDNDVAFLQGYAHARDRFFQMDFSRRGASGSVAELVGPAALASDVQLRTLGLRRAAFATFQAMSDETRGWLKAYANGVNFWLRTNPLPPEYGALELTSAAPWSPVDSIVIGKALAFQLSFDLDIEYTLRLGGYQQAGQAGGFNGTALFFEDTHRVQPPDNRVSIPGFTPGAAAPTGARATGAAAAEAAITAGAAASTGAPPVTPETMALARALRDKVQDVPLIGRTLQPREGRGGSNFWIVAGSETASGRPILANDPHLGLDLPSVFVEMHLVSASGLNVTGVSVPGTPGIIQGCTERFCWGTTTNPLDVTDTYQEQFVLNVFGLPTHTVYQGRFEPVVTVIQEYRVNPLDGTPDNVRREPSIGYLNGAITILVPRRNFGPVLQIAGTTGLSVQYTGWGATFELESFRRINRATNLTEFRNALTFFDVGSQNFGYADVDGNIAYFTSAEAPVRDDLQNLSTIDGAPPFLIRDGSGTRRNEWLAVANRQPGQAVPYEVLPASEMPFVINPAAGYVANANNDPAGTTLDNNAFNQMRPRGGLYYLNFAYSSYRQGRIDRELAALVARSAPVTPADLQALQANNRLMDAELVRPHLLAAFQNAQSMSAWSELRNLAGDAQLAAAIARIAAWDLSTPTGIQAGFDPGDDPGNLAAPGATEVANAVAATLFAAWRGQAVRATIDATLTRVGLGSALPGSQESYSAFKNLLDTFATRRGTGASGVNFFQVAGAPSPEAARDFVLLRAMRDALALLASESFAPAFNRSTNLDDYRWGRLHRIVFDHPLGGPFNVPEPNALYGFAPLAANLPGVARAGGFEAVDASSHNSKANSLNGFMFGSGPARRFVGEMTAAPSLQQILPGGQSGVLGSPAYASQLSRWLTNRYKPLHISVAAATANPAEVLSFAP